MQDIFSMFNLVDEHAEAKKREEEEKRKKVQEELRKKVQESKKSESKANKEEKTETFKVNEDTIIRYFGESIPITTYFSAEEIAEGILIKKKDGETERKPIDPEWVRKRMEKDYPELVQSHTDIVYLNKKNLIIPVMKAKKKGNYGKKASINGAFFYPHSKLPRKIPFSILENFIAIARLFGEEKLEVHGDIYFDPSEDSFFLDIPEQVVNHVWVEVTESGQSIVERIEDAYKVAEIHSHHVMSPFPSKQDNESERVPGMYYCIVGHIDKFFPEILVRQFLSESEGHIKLTPGIIFEYPFLKLPELDMNKIEVK